MVQDLVSSNYPLNTPDDPQVIGCPRGTSYDEYQGRLVTPRNHAVGSTLAQTQNTFDWLTYAPRGVDHAPSLHTK